MEAEAPLWFIGIDTGTQSTKVVVVEVKGNVSSTSSNQQDAATDIRAKVIARGSCSHEQPQQQQQHSSGSCSVEQHPSMWVAALDAALQQCLTSLLETEKYTSVDLKQRVKAIGVSGQQHGFVPLDAKDEVIRPAKLWCDTSTEAEAKEISASSSYIRRVGNTLPCGFTASKILWMKKHEPDNFSRLHTVLLPHDYINFFLTGVKTMEFGDASGTGLLDVRNRTWATDVMQRIDRDLPSKFPPLHHHQPHAAVGTLLPEIAAKYGFATGEDDEEGRSVLVSAGGGDNMMSAIGTGNVSGLGVVTVSLGTSGTVFSSCEKPVFNYEVVEQQQQQERDESSIVVTTFCDSAGHWLPLLCTMNVTRSSEFVKGLFPAHFKSSEDVAEAAAAVCPGSDGLMFLPYLVGERTPNLPDSTGVWFGQTPHNATPAHFARAALEGTTLGLNYGLSVMTRMMADGGGGGRRNGEEIDDARDQKAVTAPQINEIRLTGGGSKSAVWRQLCADVFGVPVVCTKENEGAAFGAALHAVWTHKMQETRTKGEDPHRVLRAIVGACVETDEATRCKPNPENIGFYRKLQKLHNSLSERLRPVFAEHKQTFS